MSGFEKIYKRFLAAVKKASEDYGTGFNKKVKNESGLSSGGISHIVSGNKKPTLESFIKVCEASGVDYKEIVCGFKPKNESESEELKQIKSHLRDKQTIINMMEEKIMKLKKDLAIERGKCDSCSGPLIGTEKKHA